MKRQRLDKRGSRWPLTMSAASAVLIAGFLLTDLGDATVKHVNAAGGYSISAPRGWDVTKDGATMKLTAPGSDVIVGIEPGSEGSLRRAARDFAASIAGSYRDALIHGTENERLADRPAVSVAGTATNASGVPIRWMAITIDIGERNLGVSVFARDDVRPSEILPTLNRMLASLTLLEGSDR